MPEITFERIVHVASFRDPRQDYATNELPVEIRIDPLTGQISRLFPFRSFAQHEHDWTPFVEESKKKFCPFCPENLNKVTPKFPLEYGGDGHIRVGDAVAIPNIHPYEKHTAVVVMSSKHYLSMSDLSIPVLVESFQAAAEFLRRTRQIDPDGARYVSINWNYMPYSGGSLIHPHLQVLAGPRPCPYDGKIISASAEYQRRTGTNFWLDLVETERGIGERYLGQIGEQHWLATFAPKHAADVTAVLPGRVTIEDMTENDFVNLADGLCRVIKYYFDTNFHSFNMATYFATPNDAGFCVTARIVGRFTTAPLIGSDITHMQILHDDPWTVVVPEELARELKPYFEMRVERGF